MGTTTFSGPIKAGTIRDTTGTTVGTNVANVGNVVMCQTDRVDMTGGLSGAKYDTSIIIPARSRVVNMIFRVIAKTTVLTANLNIGSSGGVTFSHTQLLVNFPMFTTNNGVLMANSQDLQSDAANDPLLPDAFNGWLDMGPEDIRIAVTANQATATGKFDLSIFYTQNSASLPYLR